MAVGVGQRRLAASWGGQGLVAFTGARVWSWEDGEGECRGLKAVGVYDRGGGLKDVTGYYAEFASLLTLLHKPHCGLCYTPPLDSPLGVNKNPPLTQTSNK